MDRVLLGIRGYLEENLIYRDDLKGIDAGLATVDRSRPRARRHRGAARRQRAHGDHIGAALGGARSGAARDRLAARDGRRSRADFAARPADSGRQPPLLRPESARRHGRLSRLGRRSLPRARRHRPLQGGQRQVRPCRRRPSPEVLRRDADRAARRDAARRRVTAARNSRCCCRACRSPRRGG